MAQRFTLTLDIDDASLTALCATGAQLIVAKPAGTLPPNVVWLTCDPGRRTTIAWDEVYGLYAALVPSHVGAPIRILDARYPTTDRTLHPFLSDRCFATPIASERIPPGHYDVDNRAPFAATFGLLQAATMNGIRVRSPVNAATLVPGSAADFVAVTTLYVWVGPPVARGSAAAGLPARAVLVPFTPSDPARRLRYDSASAGFIFMSSTTLMSQDKEDKT
ncbi:MAG: hypothetical protein QOI11_3412 [Candidatus Eremiobacteraeota bacterium]|jgi:hypothetical protein|nr:hypothetical protein [Candidatus Eremiobacteraeota bacterium]